MSMALYIKDTIHLLQILENLEISKSAILVTVDVELLYGSIPHDKGVATVGYVLKKRATQEFKLNQFNLQMLNFIL